MANALRLFGLRAIVTGAASGIGEAIVRTLIKHGAEVLAVDSSNSGIETHFNSVRGVHGAVVDINSADVATQLSELASTELGVVDIVVCNFSMFADAPISDGDDEALGRIVSRKNTLVESITEQLLPLMKSSPAGRIIVLGFNRSVFSQDGAESYRKSQGAIAELTRKLAAKTAQYGINVNYIQLGAIMTPESRRVFNNDKALRDYCIQRSAAKRLGEPVDIAKVALFLATDDSVFVSGTGIVVDGGVAGK
ncbi:MAG: SDR family oxidoreductase [Gammaproteobacteria bacterium]|nr:SDR family oxidoreductase [Gammaproteobacteria bacterium]